MKKAELREKEMNEYEVIKVLTGGMKEKRRACLKLGCSLRTINRMIRGYNPFLIHQGINYPRL
jgi:hypothetical protein